MADKFRAALGAVRAEDALKAGTLLYLREELQKRGGRKRSPLRRIAVALASLAILLAAAVAALYVYYTPAAFVDVDVNPSIGLALNGFDRVIGVQAYNSDGEDILAGVSLRHRSYEDALTALLDAMNGKGYITGEGLVSVTLQTGDGRRESPLLSDVRGCITSAVYSHCPTARIDVFAVDAATRSLSRGYGISPAKYLAIQELMSVDPYASIEGCRSRSIREIQQETAACMMRGGRHGTGPGADSGGYGGGYSGGEDGGGYNDGYGGNGDGAGSGADSGDGYGGGYGGYGDGHHRGGRGGRGGRGCR